MAGQSEYDVTSHHMFPKTNTEFAYLYLWFMVKTTLETNL